jgi:hypothetical protein
MDRTKAAEIQKHLLDAADAIGRASDAIFGLGRDERAEFAVLLGKIGEVLHFEFLEAVYARHPDLRPPPREQPVINTDRRWEDIALPESVSEADLDQIIFSVVSSRWRKTAMVIVKAYDRCKELALPVDPELLGIRIRALVEANRLDNKGDVRKWRFSEVRLKGGV